MQLLSWRMNEIMRSYAELLNIRPNNALKLAELSVWKRCFRWVELSSCDHSVIAAARHSSARLFGNLICKICIKIRTFSRQLTQLLPIFSSYSNSSFTSWVLCFLTETREPTGKQEAFLIGTYLFHKSSIRGLIKPFSLYKHYYRQHT